MFRLLIVSAWFPPATAVGALRPLRLARQVVQQGGQVAVLTLPPACGLRIDPALTEALPAETRVESVRCLSPWHHSTAWDRGRPGIGRLLEGGRRAFTRLTDNLIPVDELYPWTLLARRTGEKLARETGAEVIWATAPPLSSLVLAHAVSLRTGIPWVADFRDVPLATRKRGERRAEAAAVGHAAGISHSAPAQIEELKRRYPAVAGLPQALVLNGFEPDEVAQLEPSRSGSQSRAPHGPTIVHGGTLYSGSRSIDGLLEGLARLRADPAGPGRELRLIAYGEQPADRVYVEQAAARHQLEQAVEFRPALPRREYLAACRSADLLLLVIGRDGVIHMHSGAIPGKLYDYFMVNRPILVVGPPGCEAGRIVEQANAGIAVDDVDPAACAEAINRLLRGEGAQGPLDLSARGIQHMEVSRTFEPLLALLDRVRKRAP